MLFPLLALASDFQTPAITAQDLHDRQGGADPLLVIDVRDVGEYKSGHVPGAINIPQKKLEQAAGQVSSMPTAWCFTVSTEDGPGSPSRR